MLKNYFKIALRTLTRHKMYTAVNILGLAVGLAGCLLIFAFIRNETSFENCHDNRDRIYRVATIYMSGGSTLPSARVMPALAPALRAECPEVESAVRFRYFTEVKTRVGDAVFTGATIICAEPDLFDIFTIPILRGQAKNPLEAPSTVFLSESTARRYFGDADPIGQTITVMNQYDCQVTGIYRDIPPNSQLRCDLIASYSTLKEMGMDTESWRAFSQGYTYLLVKEGSDIIGLTKKISRMVERNLEEEYAKRFWMFLQPLGDIYLHSILSWELYPSGDTKYISLFSIVAGLILLIACVNFVNLTTARVAHRVREVGMRKVIGAKRGQLIRQFLGESTLTAGIATLLGLSFFEVGRPALEAFIGRPLVISAWTDPLFAGATVIMALVAGLVAGSYPALYLSKLDPIENLKGYRTPGSAKAYIRRVLVVFQFVIAAGLIFLTFSIHKQVHYLRTTDKGFDATNVAVMRLDDDLPSERCLQFRDRLAARGNFASVSAMGSAPGEYCITLQYFKPENKLDEEAKMLQVVSADSEYVGIFGLQIIEGENLSGPLPSGNVRNVIITGRTVKEFEIEEPIGFKLMNEEAELRVIGVINDYSPYPLTSSPLPLAVMSNPDAYEAVAVRLSENDVPGQIAGIRQVWNEVIPEAPFEFAFLDDIINNQYDNEEKLGILFSLFAFLSITIACLGIFALSAYSAERRTREIGIRKALGATIASVVQLLSKEFFILVAIANIIAWPIAYYILNLWLQSFYMRIPVGWQLFALAGALTIAIALGTVGFQSVRVARADPVKALRHE